MSVSITNTADVASDPRVFAPPERARISPGRKEFGWRVLQRIRCGYYTPEEWYQSIVERLVNRDTRWIDIGGGQILFSHNQQLATLLSERCKLLVGLDPSGNILKNETVHVRVQSSLEGFDDGTQYDLATLHFVAEHVSDPESFLGKLASIVKPGGHVVLVTPHKWSAVPIIARLIPSSLHAACVHLLTPKRKEDDVFPTCYKLNTCVELKRQFSAAGFDDVLLERIADCSVFHRYRIGTRLELGLYRLCQRLHVGYPESNIVGVFRRRDNEDNA